MQKVVTNPIKKILMMSEQDIDAMNCGEESDHDLISTEILDDIHDRSQTQQNVYRREAH